MGDYDDYSDYRSSPGGDSGGIIGSIISLLILAAIWPYLLALLGFYIAYLAAVAVLEWMAQNPLMVVSILLGIVALHAIYRLKLIRKAWRKLVNQFQPKAVAVELSQDYLAEELPNLAERKFIPSTNLYCYWCTKKLGIKAWESNGKYYCDECNAKQLANP
jgi:hypothetical protein